jgi:lipoprotein NlpI
MPVKFVFLGAFLIVSGIAVRADAQSSNASASLVQRCVQTTQPSEREKACAAALEAPGVPQDLKGRIFYYRALARLDMNRAAEAVPDLNEALKLDAQFWPAYWVRADILGTQRKHAEAAADWDAVVHHQPKMATPLLQKAIMQDYGNRNEDALATMALAVDRARDDEERAQLYYHRGVIHEHGQNWQNAIADYSHALRLQDDMRLSYYGRGRAMLLSGNAAGAIADLDKAASLKPGDGYVTMWQYIARSRVANREVPFLKEQRGNIDLDKWPGPVIRALLGEITPATAASAAIPLPFSAEANTAAARCEVEFFLGQQHLIRGERDKAAARFEAAIATGVVEFIEYRAAQHELKRIRR